MELWFLAALGGSLFAGLSNFYFKFAAMRGYSAELFSLYAGMTSTCLIFSAYILLSNTLTGYGWYILIAFLSGFGAAMHSIFKVYALKFIDATIYFPLFKLLSPMLAIIAGIIIFGESFTSLEWIGMSMGLLVPLLLITKSEKGRQNNLLLGLGLVVVTGIISAIISVLNKIVVDEAMPIAIIMLYAAFGVLAGTFMLMVKKNGVSNVVKHVQTDTTLPLVFAAFCRALLINASFGLTLYAYSLGGTLAVVQSVHSMYILIPVVLSIYFYKEHWNTQKVVAVVLSVGALALLG